MAEFPPLDCSKIMFRAILHASQINRDGTLKWQVFKRLRKDHDGVSVSFTEAGAVAGLKNPIAGMMTVHVGRVRNVVIAGVGLNVIQDAIDHAYIDGIPYPDESLSQDEQNTRNTLMMEQCMELAKSAGRLK
jgi:hypothetical protein